MKGKIFLILTKTQKMKNRDFGSFPLFPPWIMNFKLPVTSTLYLRCEIYARLIYNTNVNEMCIMEHVNELFLNTHNSAIIPVINILFSASETRKTDLCYARKNNC